MTEFGGWRFSDDREATVAAYLRAEAGGAERCDCAGCRNFVAVRKRVFPAGFLALLESLGIDPTKDGEVYHIARLEPGRHCYGGWFHFVGTLQIDGDFPSVKFEPTFSAHMCAASAPRLEALEGHEVVQLEFHVEDVPWVSGEEEIG